MIRVALDAMGGDHAPREVVRGWVSLLSVLEQNPGADWRVLLGKTQVDGARDPDHDPSLVEPATDV